MRKIQLRLHARLFFTAFLGLAVLAPGLLNTSTSAADKLTPEQVVEKHLQSIGTAKARAALTTRIFAGTSSVNFRTPPPGQASGRAVLASEGRKNLIGMSFANPVYPGEQLAFNGNSFSAAFVTPGVRSALGNFLMTHSNIFKQGLMGGTLSSAWPLLELNSRDSHLEYSGEKKFDKRTVHEVKYLPKGGSDLQVSLFFDAESFRHVRTEYSRVIPAPTGSIDYSNIQEREIRYKMIEEFSDFKTESGLTLPHTYKITLTVDSQGGTFLGDWVIRLTQFEFNERLDPATFNIGS